jgi:hypothetical protein
MADDFHIQAYKIKDLPVSIVYLILKTIKSNQVFSTFQSLMGRSIDDIGQFLEICIKTNMTLHDLIGHMKRSNDHGEIRTFLSTNVVEEIRNSYMYQMEKRLFILEMAIKSNTGMSQNSFVGV